MVYIPFWIWKDIPFHKITSDEAPYKIKIKRQSWLLEYICLLFLFNLYFMYLKCSIFKVFQGFTVLLRSWYIANVYLSVFQRASSILWTLPAWQTAHLLKVSEWYIHQFKSINQTTKTWQIWIKPMQEWITCSF